MYICGVILLVYAVMYCAFVCIFCVLSENDKIKLIYHSISANIFRSLRLSVSYRTVERSLVR